MTVTLESSLGLTMTIDTSVCTGDLVMMAVMEQADAEDSGMTAIAPSRG